MIKDAVEMARLLVTSRDSAVLDAARSIAEANCWQMETAVDAWDAMDKVHSGVAADLLVLDMPNDLADGLQILRALRRIHPTLPLVLIGHAVDCERKQDAMRMGACDYLTRPFEERQLETAIRHNLSIKDEGIEADIASDGVEPVGNDNYFIGIGPVMRKLRARVALLAEVHSPVIVVGEQGSGRETIARLLHRLSVRSGFEFARVSCAALPEELLEREIFGSEAGGTAEFLRTKRGKLELCDRGTIFLDEITELPLRLQDKLAQVLREGRFTRQDRPDGVAVDVRVVAASSVPVHQAVSERRLLADLARQLSAYELRVPALRERKDELPFLSRHFMHRMAKRYGLPPREIVQAVSEAWQAYDWPGNLQELEQSVKRYLVVGERGFAFEDSSPEKSSEEQTTASIVLRNGKRQGASSCPPHGGICGYKSLRALLQSVKEEAERNAIALALEKTGWNRKAAARLLKTSYRTVLYKIEQYQMSSYDLSSSSARNGLETRKTGSYGDSRADVPAVSAPRVAGSRLSEQ